MASLQTEVANEIFSILKGWGKKVTIFDSNGNLSVDPSNAVSFFVDPDKMLVNISFDSSDATINLYLSDVIESRNLPKFLDSMRNVANRFNLLFNVKKYNKEITPKDFAHKFTVSESMWGSTKTSYQQIGNCRLIIKHTSRINEQINGARSRRINSIYVESKNGERFLFSTNSLRGARAFANHISNGGKRDDDISKMIFSESEKLLNLKKIKRLVRKNQITDESFVTEVEDTIKSINANLLNLNKEKFYSWYCDNSAPEQNIVLPYKGDIEQMTSDFSNQLNINFDDALYPTISDIAASILGKRQMTNFDFDFTQGQDGIVAVTFENADAAQYLKNTLVEELGLTELNFFENFNNLYIFDSRFNNLLTNLVESTNGLSILENTSDKYFNYAIHWLTNRYKKVSQDGYDNENSNIQKQAEILANGLKQIVSGTLPVIINDTEIPRFGDKNSEIAFKLAKALESKSGVSDELFSFVSSIIDKLHTTSLNANEAFFAKRLADIVDKAIIENRPLPEEIELENWSKDFVDSVFDGDLHEEDETDFERYVETFDFNDFVDYANLSKVNSEYVEDNTFAKKYIMSNLVSYVSEMLGKDVSEYENMIDDLCTTVVIPRLEKQGLVIEETVDLDESLFDDSLNEDEYARFGTDYDDLIYIAKEVADKVVSTKGNLTDDIWWNEEPKAAFEDTLSEVYGYVNREIENAWDISYFADDEPAKSDIRDYVLELVKDARPNFKLEEYGFLNIGAGDDLGRRQVGVGKEFIDDVEFKVTSKDE